MTHSTLPSNEVLRNIYNSQFTENPDIQLGSLVEEGKVSQGFENQLMLINQKLKTANNTNSLVQIIEQYEVDLENADLDLFEGESEFLYSFSSCLKYSTMYLVDNNIQSLPAIPLAATGGIPCGAALVGYQASLVGLCMATGPVGWVVGGIGFGMGIWGVLDSCD